MKLDDFDIQLSQVSLPKMEGPTFTPIRIWSEDQFEIIKRYIEDFEATLDEDHDVGLMLTNFGQTIVMQVEEISYEESVLMVFKGLVNGNSATLIQHINQLNFMLTTVPRNNPEEPKRKIGFSTEQG